MSTASKLLPTPPNNFSTTLSADINTSDLTIGVDSVSGLPTEGIGVIYAVDADGNPKVSSIEFIHWTGISGSNLTLTDTGDRGWTDSTSGAQGHSAGDKFEVWVHSDYNNRTWGIVEHNADGTHSDITADSVTVGGNAVLTSDSSLDWTTYTTVTPTRSSANATTKMYQLTFASVDLSAILTAGRRVKFTQDGATVYGIIHKVAFSTNTTVDIYCGTDYQIKDTASFAITNFAHSGSKSPSGFDPAASKWTITTTYASGVSLVNTTISALSTVPSGHTVTKPVGAWNTSSNYYIASTSSSGAFAGYMFGLGQTTTNIEYDKIGFTRVTKLTTPDGVQNFHDMKYHMNSATEDTYNINLVSYNVAMNLTAGAPFDTSSGIGIVRSWFKLTSAYL